MVLLPFFRHIFKLYFYLFHVLQDLPHTGVTSAPPIAVVDPHVINGVEVLRLSAPRCRPSLLFS